MGSFHFIFAAVLALGLSCARAHAEDLPNAPGWALNKITESAKAEENTYSEARTYFSLKPPDGRPAITVDSRTADRLRSGEVYPESAYAGQQGGKKAEGEKREEDEFVYGKHGNGIVVAEPVASTLTAEEGRKDSGVAVTAATNPSSALRPSGGTTGIAGFSSGGGLNSGASHETARQAIQAAAAGGAGAGNSSGASRPLNAPAEGGGSAPVVDPRTIASAQNALPPDAGKPVGLVANGVTVNNAASGFGVPIEKSKGSKDDKEAKDFIVWPEGDPDSKDPAAKPKCTATSAKTYDRALIERLSVPSGCNSVRIRAWGAGGGAGNMSEGGSIAGGDGGGGAYVYSEGTIDTKKYDLIVVVGGPGGDAKGAAALGGFPGGGKGGGRAGMYGGGGGGYSGLFLVERGKDYGPGNDKPLFMELAVVVAAGGGGGSPSGEVGGVGGIAKGGGALGAGSNTGGPGGGNGKPGSALHGGDGGDGYDIYASGGGGGGGFFGGGGGGGTNSEEGTAGAGGGGSSFYRFLDGTVTIPGDGSKAGNYNYSPRGKAGNAGKSGLVILEFY